MQWFSALIPAYPQIQKRAQEELDRVVGRDRLPTVEDEPSLPYCHGCSDENFKPTYRTDVIARLSVAATPSGLEHLMSPAAISITGAT